MIITVWKTSNCLAKCLLFCKHLIYMRFSSPSIENWKLLTCCWQIYTTWDHQGGDMSHLWPQGPSEEYQLACIHKQVITVKILELGGEAEAPPPGPQRPEDQEPPWKGKRSSYTLPHPRLTGHCTKRAPWGLWVFFQWEKTPSYPSVVGHFPESSLRSLPWGL